MHDEIIGILKETAICSDLKKKLGACLIRGSRIVGEPQYNSSERYYVNRKVCYNFGHAEMKTINCNGYSLKDCNNHTRKKKRYNKKTMNNVQYRYVPSTIFVIRINTDNELANARPCRLCLEKLKQSGIRKVFYSTGKGNTIYNESVKYMISINDGHRIRSHLRREYGYSDGLTEYYIDLIKNILDDTNARRENIDIFIEFNLEPFLPECDYEFKRSGKKTLLVIKLNNENIATVNVV